MNVRKALYLSPAIAIATLLFASPAVPARAVPMAARPQNQAQILRPPYLLAPQVRLSWESFIKGPAGALRLKSLKAAITKMKSLNGSPKTSVSYRRSWEYWANIHGYYGSQSPDGTVADQIAYLQQNGLGSYASYYTGITDQLPPDATAVLIWATCQHSAGPGAQQANFFAWHRMYLYYFERVLRWAANDKTLRLPYWDYTDPADLAMPAEFRNTGSVMYDAKRDPGMNNGTSTLSAAATNINTLLSNSNYFDYEYKIETGIHGYVHCTVGPTCPVAHMGDVPVAGNDPVFYHHHDNIDRLWACWQHLHPTPGGSWQTQQFSFVDETGTQVTKPVSAFVDESKLGYVYENETSCARPRFIPLNIRQGLALAAAVQGTVLGSTKSVAIKAPQTSIDIAVPKPALRRALVNLKTAGTTELVLRDVTADKPPGTLLNVYLVKKNSPATRQLVGTISWFGSFRHHGQSGPAKQTYSYDVTAALRDLGGTAVSESGVSVVIEATTGREPADRSKLDAERTRAFSAFKAESNVRIGSVELRSAPPQK